MSFSDRLDELASKASRPLCKMVQQIASSKLTQSDRDNLEKILSVEKDAPGRVSNLDIAALLRSEGLAISNTAVDRHRGGTCLCAKTQGAVE